MKTNFTFRRHERAFNLIELCVLAGCIAVLTLLVVPALAANKIQSASAGCLYNLRHLMTGWEMYRTEHNDLLIPNAPLGPITGWIVARTGENWGASPDNTNATAYTSGLLWPYLNNNLSVFHCPGDVVPSANGMRIRSYSMNGQVGSTVDQTYNSGFRIYLKGSDIIRPTPANLFVFADESPLSINDGFLQVSCNSPDFPDVPADYLENGCGFSFADGHGEVHRWQTSALRIPVVYGVSGTSIFASANNTDWLWFTQHATSHQ